MAAPTSPACGMVLKKLEAAGDITATEMTIALVRPSAPRRSVVCAPPNSPAAGITVASELPPAGVVVSDIRHLHFHSLVRHYQSHSSQWNLCGARRRTSRLPRARHAEEAAQVVVEEDAGWVEPRPHALKI